MSISDEMYELYLNNIPKAENHKISNIIMNEMRKVAESGKLHCTIKADEMDKESLLGLEREGFRVLEFYDHKEFEERIVSGYQIDWIKDEDEYCKMIRR